MSINKFLQPGAAAASSVQGSVINGGQNYGQAGTTGSTNSWTQEASGWTDVTFISGKEQHSALIRNGVAYVAGDNILRQLNTGNTTDYYEFIEFLGNGSGCIDISANYRRTHIIKDDGTLWGIGYNFDGCLGIGVTNDADIDDLTQEASGWTDWERVFDGYQHTGAIRNGGDLYCCGENAWYQLGLGDANDRGGFCYSTGNIEKFSGGPDYSMILTTDGKIYGVGRNNQGQLGVGNFDKFITTWTQEASGFTWIDVDCSHISVGATVAIRDDGSVWAWGVGYLNLNGVGDNSNYNTPQEIIPASSGTFTKVSLGANQGVAIDDQGRLWYWGQDGSYQDGDGNNSSTDLVRMLDDTRTWLDVTAGNNWTLGIVE